MKWIHQGMCSHTGSIVNVYGDFEKFILKVTWEPREKAKLPKGIEGEHKCSSLEALFEKYSEISSILFDDDFEYRFRDGDNDDIEPIDLEKYYKLHWEPVDSASLTNEEKEAMNIIQKVLLKWIENVLLNNLVFYWNDDSCAAVYINNKGFNSKNENDLKKHIKNPKKSWLNGTMLDITTVLAEDIVENLDIEFSELQKQVNQYMYKICAILEAKNCFRLAETAKNFRAFNVWHDEEEKVDFRLRKKFKGIYK